MNKTTWNKKGVDNNIKTRVPQNKQVGKAARMAAEQTLCYSSLCWTACIKHVIQPRFIHMYSLLIFVFSFHPYIRIVIW